MHEEATTHDIECPRLTLEDLRSVVNRVEKLKFFYPRVQVYTSKDIIYWGQFRFPRSKKKRIRKKYAKKRANWKNMPGGIVYHLSPGQYIVHPRTLGQMLKRFNHEGSR